MEAQASRVPLLAPWHVALKPHSLLKSFNAGNHFRDSFTSRKIETKFKHSRREGGMKSEQEGSEHVFSLFSACWEYSIGYGLRAARFSGICYRSLTGDKDASTVTRMTLFG